MLQSSTRAWVTSSLALVILPHTVRLPLWITLLCAIIGLSTLTLTRQPSRPLPRWLLTAMTLAGTLGIFIQYGTLLGKDAGIAILVLMLALKLLELHGTREVMLVLFLSYFLVITNFLYTQSIAIAVYMFGAVFFITAALTEASHPLRSGNPPRSLRLAGKLLAQAIPLMLVLFVLFPRIPGPLWSLPKDAHAGQTGLSDSMTPGAISKLAKSGAVAFRVQFEGSPPPPALRYWRGPVLWYTDGQSWSVNPPRHNSISPFTQQGHQVRPSGQSIRHTITLEPHSERWLFGLDMPTALTVPAVLTADLQWVSRTPIDERLRYEVTSYTHYRTGPLNTEERTRGLQLPSEISARVQTLVQQWRRKSATDADVVEQALAHFNEEPFFYTLTPPLLGKRPIEEFLFKTRRGFCEHYAAAFTLMMRIAGIAARVVTGYQGAERNPLGDYFIVRQSHAHAWSEVWLPDRGWVRVDPTAAVAPERVERSLDLDGAVRGTALGFKLSQDHILVQAFRQLRYGLDAINNGWNQWILSYDAKRQMRLLASFGVANPSWHKLAIALLVSFSLVFLTIAGRMLWSKRVPNEPAVVAYHRFCARLRRVGFVRQVWEAPMDFACRVSAARPDIAEQVNLITRLYVRMQYSREPHDSRHIRQLRRLVWRFRPR